MTENFKHLLSVHCSCKDETFILVNYTCEIMLQGYLAWIYQHFAVNKHFELLFLYSCGYIWNINNNGESIDFPTYLLKVYKILSRERVEKQFLKG